MADPITIDIPHTIGKAQARERIDKGLGQLAAIVPGGAVTSQSWTGDSVAFTLEGMGQRVATRIAVFEDKVQATIALPAGLSLFASKIRATLLDKGTKLLR